MMTTAASMKQSQLTSPKHRNREVGLGNCFLNNIKESSSPTPVGDSAHIMAAVPRQ